MSREEPSEHSELTPSDEPHRSSDTDSARPKDGHEPAADADDAPSQDASNGSDPSRDADGDSPATKDAPRTPPSTARGEHPDPESSDDHGGAKTQGAAAQLAVADENREATPQFSRLLLAVVGIGGAALALDFSRSLKDLLGPVLLALTLVITAYPIIELMHRFKIPRWIGAITSLTVLYLTVAALFISMGYSVAALAEEAPKYRNELNSMWVDAQSWIDNQTEGKIDVPAELTKSREAISPGRIFDLISSLLSSLAGGTSILVLMLTVMMFMVMDSVNMHHRMDRLREAKPHLARGFQQFAEGVRSYWLVTTVFGLIVAVMDYFAFIALGVPLALTWALFSFVTNYIPTVGLIIGIIPPAGMTLVEHQSWERMVWVIVVMLLINNIIQTFIQPKFTGDAVGITATAAFLSLVFWSYALGALGAILAVPMTLMVKSLLIDIDPASRWVNALLSNDPETAHTPKLTKAQRREQESSGRPQPAD